MMAQVYYYVNGREMFDFDEALKAVKESKRQPRVYAWIANVGKKTLAVLKVNGEYMFNPYK